MLFFFNASLRDVLQSRCTACDDVASAAEQESASRLPWLLGSFVNGIVDDVQRKAADAFLPDELFRSIRLIRGALSRYC